jgi:maltose alpha-D-glucosyltransferase/alpha-amylase
VAGLLRSFNYAAYAALFAWAEQHPLPAQGYRTLETRLIEWNRTVEATFRQAYFPAMGGAESTDLPAFLAVLKLEKAVYELDYEINNRPDWLPIPCSGIQACLKEMLHE